MKNPIILAVLFTVISAAAFANSGATVLSTTSKFQVVENKNSRYDLYYVSETLGNVTVRILSENGKLINTDKLSDVKAFKRTYHLKGLPAGNYKVEVKNQEGKASQAIFHNPAIKSSLHSIVGQLPSANRFKVFVGPNMANSKVEVKIYDENDELLLKESIINVQEGFTKTYDLSKVNSDFVTFRINNGTDATSFARKLKQ